VEGADWQMAVVELVELRAVPALGALVHVKEERALAKEELEPTIRRTEPWLVVAVALGDADPSWGAVG